MSRHCDRFKSIDIISNLNHNLYSHSCRDQEIERDIRRVVIIVEIAFCVTFNVIAMVNLLNTADILDMFDDISAMFVDDEYNHFSEEFARGATIASTIYAFGIVASLVVIFGAIIFKAPLIGLASVWTVAQIVARTVLQARYYR